MTRLGKHNRNHSFPPCLQFIQRSSSKNLSPPRPDINDAPWAHFLSPVDDDDDPSDFLDFTAGIIAGSDATLKKKPTKFRPSNAKKWDKQVINFHHGTYQRRDEDHGFVENRQDPWSHIVEQDVMTASHPSDTSRQARPRMRSRTRTLSGQRRSWREPSVDIFTVEEEAVSDTYLEEDEEGHEHGPAILINDYSDVTPQIKFVTDDEMFTTPHRPARDSMFSDDGIFAEYDPDYPTHGTPSLRLSPTILFDDDSLPEFALEGSYLDSAERARL
jgi:hypothetical protein